MHYEILNESKYCFRTGRFTSTAILDLVGEIPTALDNQKHVSEYFLTLENI